MAQSKHCRTGWEDVKLFLTLFVCTVFSPLALAKETASQTPCTVGREAFIWAAPQRPSLGQPLRVKAVAIRGIGHELIAWDPKGRKLALKVVNRGGPPENLTAEIPRPESGNYRIELLRQGKPIGCRQIVMDGSGAGPTTPREWNEESEAFYAAWVEQLFDVPLGQDLNLSSLTPLLRNPERNFLYNYADHGEDAGIDITPDCADLPYVLRAYFAWKLELPMGFRECGRGAAGAPPRCGPPTMQARSGNTRFSETSKLLMDTVHSGSARTALRDNATDYYPVELSRAALRPGTVFADPYGHVLILAKWVPQTDTRGGQLLAVDAQPDNTVSRKRFWEGTFLFANDVPDAGPGFKAFRPLVQSGGTIRPLSNAELSGGQYGTPYSIEQAHMTAEDFYARMAKLINPQGLDPVQAYEETLNALVEQLEARVGSVNNGERYVRENPHTLVSMPDGADIFQTTGPWEDYATPSRDMRLIIAMRVLSDLPQQITRHPELFLLKGRSTNAARSEVEKLHAKRIRERGITYLRSDGSEWQLTVAEILARKAALEVAYNPNDCAERRWGARPGTEEYSPCTRKAPADQEARMQTYRHWFHEGRRPPA